MKDKIKSILREDVNKNRLGVSVTRPNQVLIIMRGISGSGKSTAAKNLKGNGVIHSTDTLIDATGDYDKFFRDMVEKNNFQPLSKMHQKNLDNAIADMKAGKSPVVIDNTNLTPSEPKGYVVAALEMGYADDNIKIVDIGLGGASAEELAKRNSHNVPLSSIEKMINRYKGTGEMTLDKILQAKEKQNVLYSAVVLDKISHDMILREFDAYIPEGWKIFAHHMTIAFKEPAPQEDLGKEVGLKVVALGRSDMAVALKVEGYPSKNAIPHITLAVNPEGGKPAMSNDIKEWKTVQTLKIRGKVTNII